MDEGETVSLGELNGEMTTGTRRIEAQWVAWSVETLSSGERSPETVGFGATEEEARADLTITVLAGHTFRDTAKKLAALKRGEPPTL